MEESFSVLKEEVTDNGEQERTAVERSEFDKGKICHKNNYVHFAGCLFILNR